MALSRQPRSGRRRRRARRAAGLVGSHVAGRRPDDPQELALRADRPAGDARAVRDAPRREDPAAPPTTPPPRGTAAAFLAHAWASPAGALRRRLGRRRRRQRRRPRRRPWPRFGCVGLGSAASASRGIFGAAACLRHSLRLAAWPRARGGGSASPTDFGGRPRPRGPRNRHLGDGRLGDGGSASAAAAFASATETSLRMSIRQPVRRAASRAFWPSRPIASESIRSGTVTLAIGAPRRCRRR